MGVTGLFQWIKDQKPSVLSACTFKALQRDGRHTFVIDANGWAFSVYQAWEQLSTDADWLIGGSRQPLPSCERLYARGSTCLVCTHNICCRVDV